MGIASRGLGGELRALREAKKLSMRNVADQLGWQSSKISRIENGQQGVKSQDVASLLVIYGVTGQNRERLLARAEKTGQSGLWESTGLSRESRTMIQLEAEARSILTWQALLIPGLLQTSDYARALMKACGLPPHDLEVRVAARMGRQAVLSRDEAPKLEAIVDEGALRRIWGNTRIMVRQLRHLLDAMERPNVTLRVVPCFVGGYSGLDGSFSLVDFAGQKPVVHIEHKITGLFLEADHEISFFRKEADRLRDVALSAENSMNLVNSIAKELETA
ncbi:helix-turn-helix domain-containing protein [Marinitenerispora sediminis]|uniref:XRE family transcriptional regulator n=1 Tax=Marinitenerispora sediminis TaxID=1931232 RepID=A0A368T8E8_9ACTN|nr:helix-turn-helix transcriptional regulator [Marinitenerispora sediminis]RCV57765.1 XRE family transcriptional regulator [Marinitenerispora sediminis]RCV57897.1 XRE family transcriptional regulator [Marinitenerispora sediminis]RCV60650.1 XRE family transcriptional regulator [Marinitenerispora sediminis]